MSFRLRYGLNVLMVMAPVAACNVYNSDLLEETASGDFGPSTTSTETSSTSGSVTTNSITTTINSTSMGETSTDTTSTTGSGGSDSTDSGSTTGGGSGGDGTTATTETTTNTTSSADGGSSGAGAASGTGGTGGTGGSVATTSNPIDMALIDDLEDGNNQLKTPTYSGYWFTAVDPTGDGTIVPDPDEQCKPVNLSTPRGDSNRAMHISGDWADGDDWTAALGFNFDKDEAPIDASGYQGIHLFAKTSISNPIRLQLMVDGVTDSGHWERELDLDTDWSEVTLLWDDPGLAQPSWAETVPFDPSQLVGVQFQFMDGTIDLWIDDVRFVE